MSDCNNKSCGCRSVITKQGTQGIQGPLGPPGRAGNTGDTGAQGDIGPTGLAGTDGTDGVNGTDGLNGVNGSDGANGTDGTDGVNGALSLIQDEGSALPVQPTLNFVGDGVSAIDNPANNSTDVSINTPTFPVDLLSTGNVDSTPGSSLLIPGTLFTVPVGGAGQYELSFQSSLLFLASTPVQAGTFVRDCTLRLHINGLSVGGQLHNTVLLESVSFASIPVMMYFPNLELLDGWTLDVQFFTPTNVNVRIPQFKYTISKIK